MSNETEAETENPELFPVASSVSSEAVAKEIHRGSSLGLTVPWEDMDETYRNAISQSEPVQAILKLFRA